MKKFKIIIFIFLISVTNFNKCGNYEKFGEHLIQTADFIDSNNNNNQETKTALIFGITGQDGAYLTQFLLHKNYKVYGVVRRSSSPNIFRIEDILRKESLKFKNNLTLVYGDITDTACVFNIIAKIKPKEVYNLAAQSHVKVSFDKPIYTTQVDALGTLNILEAIRSNNLIKKTKFYQASTSELFGLVKEIPQSETTPFHPRSPYGVAKIYGYWITVNYREAYGMFACNGILFNHESPYRGDNFVTKVITQGVAKIKLGLSDKIIIGNLNSKRDWGFAGDYVEAMWLMLQQDKPEDFVVATGETHSVREFMEVAFKEIGIDIVWSGEGINEIGRDKKTGKILVSVDPRFFRPSEVDLLIGNAAKAESKLGWKRKISFKELVKIMIHADLEAFTKNIEMNK